VLLENRYGLLSVVKLHVEGDTQSLATSSIMNFILKDQKAFWALPALL
jgi:hypothetical protein